MAAKAAPKKGGGLGGKWHGIPVWLLAIAALGGAYLAYRWYENYSANNAASSAASGTTSPSGSGNTTSATPTGTDTGSAGTVSGTPTSQPGDLLDSTIAALLGEQNANDQLIGSLGGNLSDVATNAENQLGYLAAYTTTGSFQLAQTSVEANSEVAQAALTANQPTYSSPPPAPSAPIASGPNPGPAVYAAPTDAGTNAANSSFLSPQAASDIASIAAGPPVTQAQASHYSFAGALSTAAKDKSTPAPGRSASGNRQIAPNTGG